jgi:hypothetical protein
MTYDTRHEELQAIYWDFYKEVYNVRPRWMNFDAMTEAEIEAALDSLSVQAERVFARRDEEERAAIARFEKSVADTITNGAGTRATAIRWLMDAEAGANGDEEYFCYLNGLP